jgi:hypothetical protein
MVAKKTAEARLLDFYLQILTMKPQANTRNHARQKDRWAVEHHPIDHHWDIDCNALDYGA